MNHLDAALDQVVKEVPSLPTQILRTALVGLSRRLETFADAPSVVGERVRQQWVHSVSTLVRRLLADRASLEETFSLRLEELTRIDTGLGDPHHGGHTVCRLVFDDRCLYYKPRALAMERVFESVVELLGLDLRALKVLGREEHGWVWGLEAGPCDSLEAVTRFHERLGAILALARTLGATDLHEDNLLAMGEHPVLLDLETLVSPLLTHPSDLEGDQLDSSVFDTGFLPSILPEAQGGAPRLSGGVGGGLSDAITPSNLPRLRDRVVAPFDHERAFERGFEAAYERIVDRRHDLLDLLGRHARTPYRVVVRPTREYLWALARAIEVADFADTRAFRVALARALSLRPGVPDPRTLLAAELESLSALDVPAFTSAIGEEDVSASDSTPIFKVAESPLSRITRRLERMEKARELRRDRWRISAAFSAARIGLFEGTWPAPAGDAREPSKQPSGSAPRRDPREAAVAIAERLLDACLDTLEGGLDWLEPALASSAPNPTQSYVELVRGRLGLATGRVGIAVFFAAAARVTGVERYREAAERCLVWLPSLRRAVSASEPRPEMPPVGGATGIGSIVRPIELVSSLLERESHLVEAREWRALMAPDDTSNDLPHAIDDSSLHTSPLGLCRGVLGTELLHAASTGEVHSAVLALPFGDTWFDHLCCGSAGHVDMLLELSRRVTDRETSSLLAARSRALAASMLARVTAPNDYRLPITGYPRAGLFDGLAGIGVMWLRQLDDSLPFVLGV